MDGRPESGGSGARCVIWHKRGGVAPAELVAGIRKRGMEAVPADNAYAALAELVGGAGGEAESGVAPVLILAQPVQGAGAALLIEAVGRYAPGVRAWVYDPGSAWKLRAVTDEDLARWRGVPEVVVRPAARPAAPRPDLRLAGGPVESPPPASDIPAKEAPDGRTSGQGADQDEPNGRLRELLTEEELSLLLGEEFRPRRGE
jgi:hypothetical protein